jgi:hypothetical protein
LSNTQTLRPNTGAILAGARTANILAGTLVQYPGADSMVRVAATVPAAAAGDALMSLSIGGRNVTGTPGQLVPTELAAGRGPDAQLGWLYSGPALGGDLLELSIQNQDTVNAIAAPGVQFLVEVTPI